MSFTGIGDVTELLEVQLLLPVLQTKVCSDRRIEPRSLLCKANSLDLPLHHRGGRFNWSIVSRSYAFKKNATQSYLNIDFIKGMIIQKSHVTFNWFLNLKVFTGLVIAKVLSD